MSPSEELTLPDPAGGPAEEPAHLDEPLRLVHHHPGYLRIQADAFMRPDDSAAALEAARKAAEGAPGFASWSHNPKTGSVVVQYDPGAVEADDLLVHIAKKAGFRGTEIAIRKHMDRKELVGAFLDGVQGLNQVVSQVTGDRADLRELIPLALAATSVVSFLKHENRGRLPEWSGALYHSYRVFMQWHRRETRTRERVARQKEESEPAGQEPGSQL